MPIYTIGHSSHPIERFVDLLMGQRIAIVFDVRSRPYSRHAPQFSRDPLRGALAAAGVQYRYLGDVLGGLGVDDYEARAREPSFQAGLDALLLIADDHRVALMCAEENPAGCHRRHLLTPALAARGVDVSHIRGDGRVQADADLGPRQLRLL